MQEEKLTKKSLIKNVPPKFCVIQLLQNLMPNP